MFEGVFFCGAGGVLVRPFVLLCGTAVCTRVYSSLKATKTCVCVCVFFAVYTHSVSLELYHLCDLYDLYHGKNNGSCPTTGH